MLQSGRQNGDENVDVASADDGVTLRLCAKRAPFIAMPTACVPLRPITGALASVGRCAAFTARHAWAGVTDRDASLSDAPLPVRARDTRRGTCHVISKCADTAQPSVRTCPDMLARLCQPTSLPDKDMSHRPSPTCLCAHASRSCEGQTCGKTRNMQLNKSHEWLKAKWQKAHKIYVFVLSETAQRITVRWKLLKALLISSLKTVKHEGKESKHLRVGILVRQTARVKTLPIYRTPPDLLPSVSKRAPKKIKQPQTNTRFTNTACLDKSTLGWRFRRLQGPRAEHAEKRKRSQATTRFASTYM